MSTKEVRFTTTYPGATEEVVLDRGPSSGSLDEEEIFNDSMSFGPNDSRSRTRTTFYAKDAPPGRRKQYERLAKWNDGQYEPDRSIRNTEANRTRYAHTCANYLEMCPYQRDRVLHIVEDVDFSKYNPAGLIYEEVVVCIIALVLYEDQGQYFDGDIRDWFNDQDDIHSILDDAREDKINKTKMADFWTARRHLLRNTEHFDVQDIS